MTIIGNHNYDVTTLAMFKDWAQSISLALAQFGWVQTADTGQVNWSTLSAPPAANAFVYEIWRPGDALTPFYVKLQYGNNGTTGGPAIALQSGTSTDGAGNLTGFTTHRRNMMQLVGSQGAGNTYFCDYAGDASWFGIVMWHSAGANCCFGFERSRNGSGAATGAYWTQYQWSGDAATPWPCPSQQSVVFGVGAGPEGANGDQRMAFNAMIGPATTAPGGTTASQSVLFNGSVGISPVFPYVGRFDYPGLAFVVCSQADFVDNGVAITTFNVSLAGKLHTYAVLKFGQFQGFGQVCLGLRWE